MSRPWLFMLVLAACGSEPETPPTSTTTTPTPPADTLREDLLAAIGPDYWGAALVATADRVALAEGFGFADYESVPITSAMLFDIGSVSKQFTAAAVLACDMQGLLDIHAPIGAVFADVPSDKADITLYHLLTHTSGISVEDMYAVLQEHPYAEWSTREGYARVNLEAAVVAEPGTLFEYSNPGYGLLAAAVELASNTSLEEFTRTHLFEPAGMMESGFVQDGSLDESLFTTRHADPDMGFYEAAPVADYYWGWGLKGATGVISSAEEMLLWLEALRDDTVLDAAARETFFEPFLHNYAAGWFVETTPEHGRKIHHSGSTVGYLSYVITYPEEQVSIIVLTNWDNDPYAVGLALEEVVLGPQTALQIDLDQASSITL